MPTDFPESSQLIGNDITEGDFKVGISQFLAATVERVGDTGSVSDAIADVLAVAESKQSKLTAGTGISITDGTIACTVQGGIQLSTGAFGIGATILAAPFLNVTTAPQFGSNTSAKVAAGETIAGSLIRGTPWITGENDGQDAIHNPSSWSVVINGSTGSLPGTWRYVDSRNATYSRKSGYKRTNVAGGYWQRIL